MTENEQNSIIEEITAYLPTSLQLKLDELLLPQRGTHMCMNDIIFTNIQYNYSGNLVFTGVCKTKEAADAVIAFRKVREMDIISPLREGGVPKYYPHTKPFLKADPLNKG